MPVDEFGREVPGGPRRDESPPPHYSRSRDRGERGVVVGVGGGGSPSHTYLERRSRHNSDPGSLPNYGTSHSTNHNHHHYSSSHQDWRSSSSAQHQQPPLRRRRSPSPPLLPQRDQRSQRPKNPEASYRYIDEPMLCEYIWKSQNNEEDRHNANGNGDDDVDEQQDQANEPKTYDEYRRRYCLNYVRNFFNRHMDDMWFRSRYSPLVRRRVAIEERERAAKEAMTIREEIIKSLQDKVESSSSSTSPDNDVVCWFVRNARLVGGTKSAASVMSSISRKRKYGDSSTTTLHPSQHPIPQSHILSMVGKALALREIPPHVTDDQLSVALMEYCTTDVKGDGLHMYSSSVSGDGPKPLYRDAFAVFDNEELRNDVLNNLIKAYHEAHSSQHRATTVPLLPPSSSSDDGIHVPRKDDTRIPDTIDLDVECSDPYGREQMETDGKGGESATADDTGGDNTIPSRKSTVVVLTQTPLHQHVQVLSAAVSSRERIGRDKEAAIMLARALDVSRGIPKESRLDDALEMLFPSLEEEDTEPVSTMTTTTTEEDMLDVAIAYLRRVHLFCFYNGCTASTNVADLLSGRHSSGTIHLRLHNADEILGSDRDDAEVMYGDLSNNSNDNSNHHPNNLTINGSGSTVVTKPPLVDLLVKRLDDSIAKALEDSNQWVAQAGAYVIDETTDEEAMEIEAAEERAKEDWLEAHCVADDGRARCAFYFCKKLFKEIGFLRKHLLKKHSDFLRAAIAQVHDEYMMRAWDREEHRPVPPILVDCGATFRFIPSPVIGAEPFAVDPEPELWEREEERRKQAQAAAVVGGGGAGGDYMDWSRQHRDGSSNKRENSISKLGGEADRARPLATTTPTTTIGGPPRGNTFVDVDDIQVEKVEIKFEDVVVPSPPKKKKKKKLL